MTGRSIYSTALCAGKTGKKASKKSKPNLGELVSSDQLNIRENKTNTHVKKQQRLRHWAVDDREC